MLMEADMRNGEIAKAICELHSKETIFAAAIQAIAITACKGKPTIESMTNALGLMQYILENVGLEIASIIAADNAKA